MNLYADTGGFSILKLSVCCVAYNHERFIAETLDGFICQRTNFEFEIVISDDSSEDRTADIIQSYVNSNPSKFKFFRNKKNLGMVGNFLQALKSCSGKYIALCDGDDYWTDPLKLQKQVDFLEANPDYVISSGKVKICNKHFMTDEYMPLIEKDTVYSFNDFLKSNRLVTATVIFRNNLTCFPDWFRTAYPVDYPLWLILLSKGGKAICFNEILGVYRMHENGVWSMQPAHIYLQKMAVTMLNCAQYLKIKDESFFLKHLKNLEKSISRDGYIHISRFKYFKLILLTKRKKRFSFKEMVRLLTPATRRYVRKVHFNVNDR